VVAFFSLPPSPPPPPPPPPHTTRRDRSHAASDTATAASAPASRSGHADTHTESGGASMATPTRGARRRAPRARACNCRCEHRRVGRVPTSPAGYAKSVHAARLYSWMRPPSRSRHSTSAVGESVTCSFPTAGSGGLRLSERCVWDAQTRLRLQIVRSDVVHRRTNRVFAPHTR
jgi:hypothetical protein